MSEETENDSNFSVLDDITLSEEDVTELRQMLSKLRESREELPQAQFNQLALGLLQRIQSVQTQPQEFTPTNGYTDIVKFLKIIFKNLWLIILIGAIGTAIAYFIIDEQPSIYEIQTSVAILPTIDDRAIPRPIDNIEIALGTYVQVLRSHSLGQRIEDVLISDFDEDDIEDIFTEVRPVANSSIIVITVQSTNADLAVAYGTEVTRQITEENPLPVFELSYRAEVLDEPQFPNSPALPNRELNLVLGAMGSLVLGVMFAFLRDTYLTSRNKAQEQ